MKGKNKIQLLPPHHLFYVKQICGVWMVYLWSHLGQWRKTNESISDKMF